MAPVTERISTLGSLGLKYSGQYESYILKDINVSMVEIKTMDDTSFANLSAAIKQRIQDYSDYYAAPEQANQVYQQESQLPAVAEQQQQEPEDKEVVMFRESVKIFQGAPQVLKENKLSVTGAKAAIQQLLDKIAANGGKLTEELDKEANDVLARVRSTIGSMNKKRTGITQIATALSKQFTSLEAELDVNTKDSLPGKLQKLRNDWAKWLIDEAERLKKEAEAKAEKQKQKGEFKAAIIQKIGECLAAFLFNKKQVWNKSFNEITLADYDDKAAKLKEAPTAFNNDWAAKILQYTLPFTRLTADEQTAEQSAALAEYDFAGWVSKYEAEMSELKTSLVDRLASKKAELEKAAETERLRLEEVKRQQEAEAKRKEEMARANEQQRKKLEEEAAIARQQGQARMRELEEQKRRQEEEQKRREQEEDLKLQQQKADEEKKARDAGNLAAASMTAASLFESATAIASGPTASNARTGYEIAVTHPAGWVEIFELWYRNEGVKMNVEEMGKKSLNQMKKFAEGLAKDGGDKIVSKYLTYTETARAVNKAEKVK